jgi:hypothetical protein
VTAKDEGDDARGGPGLSVMTIFRREDTYVRR